jgi:ABC-type uncharacterized transport system permease subunit
MVAIAGYALTTLHAVSWARRGYGRGDWVNYGLFAGAAGIHSGALLARGFSVERCPVTNLFEAILFVTWALGAGYVIGGLWRRLRAASVLLAPSLLAAGVFALQPSLDRSSPDFDVERTALSLHVALVLLAYAAFGLAAVAGALFLLTSHGEEGTGMMGAHAERKGPEEGWERVLLGFLAMGLVLLTAGLAVSFGLMRERYGVVARPDAKIAWSVWVWGVYLALLVSRLRFRQGLPRVAWGAVGGFLFVVLTFWGTNLLSPIHHP